MRKRWFLWGGGILLIYLIGVAVAVFLSLNRVPDLFSSPTELRDSPEFKSSRLGILESARRSGDQDWPADQVWNEPEVFAGEAGGFLVDWGDEPLGEKIDQLDRWAGGLEGDDELELVAFASWVPESDDPVGKAAEGWQARPVFRDAKSLDLLTDEALDALGVPEEFRRLTPPIQYRSPKLRLLFRSRNMEFVRFVDGDGGDQRTNSVVTYDLDSLGEKEPMFASIGDWTRMDMALLVWHDTPLKFYLRVLTGEPEMVELEQRTGAQAVFGEALRVQWLRRIDGVFSRAGDANGFAPDPSMAAAEIESVKQRISDRSSGFVWMEIEEFEPDHADPHEAVLLRVSSDDYLRTHCGWIDRDGKVDWYWSYEREPEGIAGSFTVTDNEPPADGPLKLVFLPKMAELTFELAGMPDLPNSRDTEDLFNVRIPRLTLPSDPDDAEDELIAFLSVAVEVKWDHTNLWEEELPGDFPVDHTFRNQTPQQLLTWYKQATPHSKIRYDEEAKVLYLNEEKEGWWDRFKTWVMEVRNYF